MSFVSVDEGDLHGSGFTWGCVHLLRLLHLLYSIVLLRLVLRFTQDFVELRNQTPVVLLELMVLPWYSYNDVILQFIDNTDC